MPDDRTVFRFEAGEVAFTLEGSEDFVRKNLPQFLAYVSRTTGFQGGHAAPAVAAPPAAAVAAASASVPAPAAAPSAAAPSASATSEPPDLAAWWERNVPRGARLSMQDQILVFAYWMRTFKKYVFGSDDIRRGFAAVGQEEPKSLLQILGTLKRDHNLILGTERRGEYMLNTTGIDRVRQIIGAARPAGVARADGPGTEA